MNYEIPNIITTFLNAFNSQNEQTFMNCLTEDAYVHDAGRDILGTKAIQHWINTEAFAYNVQMRFDSAKKYDNDHILTLKMSGDYDKKLAPYPTYMDFHFTLANNNNNNNKICKLIILLNKSKSLR